MLVTVAISVGEGMGVGRSVGNSVLVADVVMLGSSKAVAEGASLLVGSSVSAGASGVLAGRQPEISTANATKSAETVNNRREASKLTFLGNGDPRYVGDRVYVL